ncbi:helix-turn-helix domain-containing protein [Roseburia hominis]|uniref:helix-turn-helix domain-containing protein n=1 Tax=Roseburia hominis TaxID=301301 RepID=UPI003AB49DA5
MQVSDEEVKVMLQEVSRKIRKERLRRGLSMARLAEIANLSVSHISKVEAEQCEIGLRALLKIATALGMEVTELLPDEMKTIPKMPTNGEKFEAIMQGANQQTIEFVLKMSEHMATALNENVSYKKQKS